MGDNVKSCRQSMQSVLGDRRETSGDKSETNVKSCGQSIQSVLGDKRKPTHVKSRGRSTQSDRWETSGGRCKCKVTRAKYPSIVGDRWETSGGKREANVSHAGREQAETSGRQV